MKWNTKPPKEDGYYLTTQYDEFWKVVKVFPVVYSKGEWVNSVAYPRTMCRDVIFAWANFPDFDDKGWNEIPHYTDDTKFRDYFPKEDGTYIIKGINGWEPYTQKYVITHSLIDGEWSRYRYKYDFVYGWMELPDLLDITDKEPIWNKEEWKKYKTSWKETQTKSMSTE